MRTRSLGLTLFAGVAMVVSACAGGASPSPSTAAPTSAPPASSPPASVEPTGTPEPTGLTCDTALKVGLVTDVGRINDKGFNQSAYEGMIAAAEEAPTCFDTDYIETTSQSDYAKNIGEFADAGYDIVIGVGFLIGDALGDASKEFPDTKFVGIDAAPSAGHDENWTTNGESLFYAEDQSGYMAGVLAASISESQHIGVVGGLVVVPPVERFVEGYIDGAKDTKPGITVDFVYTTSFTDPPQGKNAATQMINNGADVIFGAGGLTGNGALEAACQAGKLAIGVDKDQYFELPGAAGADCLVTSATKNIVETLKQSLLRIAGDEFTPGFTTNNAANNGIALAPFHDNADKVPADVATLLEETLAGLADGSIVPDVKIDGKTP